MARAIVSQCAGVTFVESMENSSSQVTLHRDEISGTQRSSSAEVSAGARPLGVTSEAMVPPVPSIRTFFMVASCPQYKHIFGGNILQLVYHGISPDATGAIDKVSLSR